MTRYTLESGGVERDYLIYVPESYMGDEPVPLVITLHGFAGNAAQQAEYSGWNDIADEAGFIAVYPEGIGSPQRWNSGQREIEGVREQARGPLAQFLGGFFETVPVDDVAFMRDLIGELQAMNCIDSARIYVNGLSNGGGMTNRIACEMADVVAAVGMVAGAYTEFPGGCHPARPIPLMAFHGTDDPIVPYGGNESVRFPAAEQWAVDWAERDACDPVPATLQVSDHIVGTRYAGCADDAEVVFYSIEGGGHTWPGSAPLLPFLLGSTTQEINASAAFWAFFEAHPLQ
jgi:polyhydroxybutyrate depolymerase